MNSILNISNPKGKGYVRRWMGLGGQERLLIDFESQGEMFGLERGSKPGPLSTKLLLDCYAKFARESTIQLIANC